MNDNPFTLGLQYITLATSLDQQGDTESALQYYLLAIEVIDQVKSVSQTTDQHSLEQLSAQFKDRVNEIQAELLAAGVEAKRPSVDSGPMHQSLSASMPTADSRSTEDKLVSSLAKRGFDETRIRHGIEQLRSIGLDIEDSKFEEILADHTAETLHYLAEKEKRHSSEPQEPPPPYHYQHQHVPQPSFATQQHHPSFTSQERFVPSTPNYYNQPPIAYPYQPTLPNMYYQQPLQSPPAQWSQPHQPSVPLYPAVLTTEEQLLQQLQQQQHELQRQQEQLQDLLRKCTAQEFQNQPAMNPSNPIHGFNNVPLRHEASTVQWPSIPSHLPESVSAPLMRESSRASLSQTTPTLQPATSTKETPSKNSTLAPLWVPDESVSECPLCAEPFTLFFRRHHCRACGKVVCGLCSNYQYQLYGGEPLRVCKLCYKELTGKKLEDSLVMQTAQLSIAVAKNVKVFPQSAYELFINAVIQRVPINEQRASALSSVTSWSTQDIQEMAHAYKLFCTGDLSTFASDDPTSEGSVDLSYCEFQNIMGLLGYSETGTPSPFISWIFTGFGASHDRISFSGYVHTLNLLFHGDQVSGLKWAYSSLKAHESQGELWESPTISYAHLVHAMESINSILSSFGLDPEARAIKFRRAKEGMFNLGLDAEIGPLTFASGIHTKAILDAYLTSPDNVETESNRPWVGYPLVDESQVKKRYGNALFPGHMNFNLGIYLALGIQKSVEAMKLHYSLLKQLIDQPQPEKSDSVDAEGWVILEKRPLSSGPLNSWVAQAVTKSYVYKLPPIPYLCVTFFLFSLFLLFSLISLIF
eukprot:TRINITY_DN4040_c0_g1_i3.p1 TRINITY_DN4040_c0_g1~~TRINITY_DN4040_c0_g1_i3.p1  ORF type:complete len:810 (-),score=116.52 TRINITY_DN4040_c0_g1_i3:41-2470(-)